MAATAYGISFSTLYCDELGVDWKECFQELVSNLGVRRMRLMSYWDRIEAEQGTFVWDELDWQINECKKLNVAVSLCIGVRQPRYPECHPPEWAQQLKGGEFATAVLTFNKQVIERYKDQDHIISWQLENEALNHGIGTCTDYSRDRLQAEYAQLASYSTRPIIMSTSDSVGLPIGPPTPDIVGFSVYLSQYDYEKQQYTFSRTPALWHRFRAAIIRFLLRREVICHELQCEPWGPRATVELSDEEQAFSMNPERFARAIRYTEKTGLTYADLWGAEWWYWRKTARKDPAMWDAARAVFATQGVAQ